MKYYLNRNENDDLDLFDDEDPFFNLLNNFAKGGQNNMMKTDIKETENEYVLYVDVPGIDKKDIQISLEKKYLVITASTSKEENTKYIRKERFYGTSTRSFYVGDIAKEDIKASFDNGVLIVSIPKEAKKKEEEKKYIEIQ
ncbi:MAG: Hsp20/alpha crystallin family protein [Erysipelotrichaceae bacterium]|nr:Hsp20/alpha crystallin family protein [Erysipelotrichaceae bacterium]